MFDFRVLGPVSVHDGQEERAISARRLRSVLVLLLLQAGTPVSADQLVDEVWDGEPPESAATTLHSYVMRLRRALGGPVASRLRTVDPGYLIEIEPGELDVDRFRAQREAGCRAARAADFVEARRRFGEALGEWRGEPLADLPALARRHPDVPVLQEQRLQCAEWLFDAELELGRHAEALPQIRRFAVDHPLREKFAGQLMVALHRSGRRSEALEAFLLARAHLVEQLGIEPSGELQEIHRWILSDEDPRQERGRGQGQRHGTAVAVSSVGVSSVALSSVGGTVGVRSSSGAGAGGGGGGGGGADSGSGSGTGSGSGSGTGSGADSGSGTRPCPRQLPARPRVFVGREDEMREILGYLDLYLDKRDSAGSPVVVALTGPGGIGKSTLAIAAAHRAAGRFEDGQLYADLRGSSPQPRPVTEVLARVLRDLGVEERDIPADEQDRAAHYRSILARRSVLVVLDDVRDAGSVRALLPGEGASAVVLTSRWRLASLTDAEHVQVRPLAAGSSLALFRSITGAEQAAGADAVAGILRVCSGIPLAIAIAATRLTETPQLSADRLAGMLADQRRRLAELAVDDLSVRSVFESSRFHLSADQARAFDLLGILAEPDGCVRICLDAAAVLLGRPRAEAEWLLDRLVGANLLESTAYGQYRFHDLIRPYAFESARRLPQHEVAGAVGRLARWVLAGVVAADQALAPERRLRERLPDLDREHDGTHAFPGRDEALAWLEDNRECMTAVVQLAYETGLPAAAWRIAVAGWSFYILRQYLVDLLTASRYAVIAAEAAGEPSGVAWSQSVEAGALHTLGRFDEAEDAWVASLRTRETLGDQVGIGLTLNNLGALAYAQKRYEASEEWFNKALAVHRETGDTAGAAMSLNNLGHLRIDRGRPQEAIALLEAALAIRRETGNQIGEGMTLQTLGTALISLRRVEEALQVLREAERLHRTVGNLKLEAETRALIQAHSAEDGC